MINNQRKQWEFLKRSFELGRLPHALLFFGQEHLGKKKLAVEFARLFLGKDIEKGINPDFILVEPGGKPASAPQSGASAGKEIQISQIRNLIEKLSFKPYLANLKIALINNAHLMTQEAQNCFLKFLEEPKDKTFLILITAYPSLLLPTILSRVQKIRFFPTKEFQQKEINHQFTLDLNRIVRSDLAARFQYAKDVSQDSLGEILDSWLRCFRGVFLCRLNGQKTERFSQYSLAKLKNIIKQIQSTKFLISTTNINPRLALEILLMKI